MNKLLIGLVLLPLMVLAAVSVWVEMEAADRHEALGGQGPQKALVLYHPSRDAHFSDDLSAAFADGLKASGLAVERATLNSNTPAAPQGYALIAVVSNTYYARPDLPTLHYLERARLDGTAVIGLIGGLGSTDAAQRRFDQALRRTGARVLDTRSYWIWRPNDPAAAGEPNRAVATRLAREWGAQSGRALRAGADAPGDALREPRVAPAAGPHASGR
jgi:hypothetical protein